MISLLFRPLRQNSSSTKPKVETNKIAKVKNICYINLADIGKCLYGNKCGNEHINQLYVWKILKPIFDQSVDVGVSIANRLIPDPESEVIETAFCNPENEEIETK